jgi:oxygen-independent coproporphyrinogen-3 oxidase
MASGMSPTAVYIHTPFCPSKCGYCDFNSFAMTGEIIERTVAATVREIETSPFKGSPAKTIFFGGGTPTFLSADQLDRILTAVRETHPPAGDIEVSSEANPGTVDSAKFSAMKQMGFNRVSIGAQSFQAGDLIQLGRVHQASDIAVAVRAARQAGFESVSLDLMFALSGQSMTGWKSNISTALGLNPDHLSMYCLTIEPNTRFYRLHTRGMLDLPDDDRQAEMYDIAVQLSEEAGLKQYEISNFAKPGHECQHNLCYWRSEDYLAYGPGAVGCMPIEGQSTRFTCLKHPERYCTAVEEGKSTWFDVEPLDDQALRFERVMMGIRLNEGMPLEGLDLNQSALEELMTLGWAELSEDRITLTSLGRRFCSSAVLKLV